MKLSVVLGTYNRFANLVKCLESIFRESPRGIKVYVSDAGSSDGTIDYLKSKASKNLIPIFEDQKIGQAKAYNSIFKIVDTPYVAWLSDDNIVVNNSLNLAVDILSSNPRIGMVALKTKDVTGPFIDAPYIGGISTIGILNVNQGVLPTRLMLSIGGFSEEYKDYGIDPDLTAKVLFAGYDIVYTKKVSLLHERSWAEDVHSEAYRVLSAKQKKGLEIYERKFSRKMNSRPKTTTKSILSIFKNGLLDSKFVQKYVLKTRAYRDLHNIINAQYISSLDLVQSIGKPFYLKQISPFTKS